MRRVADESRGRKDHIPRFHMPKAFTAKGFHAEVHDTDDISANAVVRSAMPATL